MPRSIRDAYWQGTARRSSPRSEKAFRDPRAVPLATVAARKLKDPSSPDPSLIENSRSNRNITLQLSITFV
jgi:hypothetical protein